MTSPARRVAGLAIIAGIVCACGDGSTVPELIPGIFVVSGGGIADTVNANLQALVVEVRSAPGVRAPKETAVRFRGLDGEMRVGPVNGVITGSLITGALDAEGRAAIAIQMGITAGPAGIEVSAPTLDLIDIIRYTVLAGSAAQVVVAPLDTLLYFDASYVARAKVVDAFGNPRSDRVSWSAPPGSSVTVSSAGVVRPGAPGRHHVIATAGTMTGSGWISALPRLRLVAYRWDSPAIVSQDMDGSNVRVLTSPLETEIGAHPSWIPGTNLVAYSSTSNGVQLLRVVDESNITIKRLFMTAPPATMTSQVWPTASDNGAWMYFSARDTRCGTQAEYCVFRSAISGASPELLAAVYPGSLPAPSPDGSRIAFLADGLIKIVNPDGTNLRELTEPPWLYEGPAWSPDSKFIVARRFNTGGVNLIEASSGAVIELPKTENLQTPQLK